MVNGDRFLPNAIREMPLLIQIDRNANQAIIITRVVHTKQPIDLENILIILAQGHRERCKLPLGMGLDIRNLSYHIKWRAAKQKIIIGAAIPNLASIFSPK